jgi:predicted transcriptional regulator
VSGNDLEFIDVIVLKKIDADSTVESFGSRLGGIFEAANLLGSIKLKGYIDIHSIIGNSPVLLTEKGNSLLHDLEVHSRTPITKIDKAVLDSIKDGFSEPKQISRMLNINSRDIAYSLNKLWVKNYIDVSSNNGKVEITLTTLGFEDEVKPVEDKIPQEKEEQDNSVKNKIAKELIDGEEEDDDGICELENGDDSLMSKINKYSFAVIGGLLLLFTIILILIIVFVGI